MPILTLLGQSSVAAILLGIVVYLCRNLIEARLTKSVQHEFDQKLAEFKTDLEEQTKRLDGVRNAGFVALLAQRNALSAKQIESAQGLWNALIEARRGTGIAITLDLLILPAVVQRLQDPKMQEYLRSFGPEEIVNTAYLLKLNNEYAQYQPFVTPTAWALYAVYAAIITFQISKLHVASIGA